MLNRQLETNINEERLLSRLSTNLNLNFIGDSSNIKKMAMAYSEQNKSFASSVDAAISNGFLLSMENKFVELFGNQHGVFRKKYKAITIQEDSKILELSVDQDKTMVTALDKEITVFTRGSLIYTDSNIIIEAMSDIKISDIITPQFIAAKITTKIGQDSFTIVEGSSFTVEPSNLDYKSILPSFNLKINQTIGLALIEESIEDFKLRLYEATYLASNGANSLVTALTKEVPMLKYLEVDNFEDDRAIKIFYPYTTSLIEKGEDDFLLNYLIPLIESNLVTRSFYGALVYVYPPQPLVLNITIDLRIPNSPNQPGFQTPSPIVNNNRPLPTQAFLDSILLKFNTQMFNVKENINRQMIVEFFNNYLLNYNFEDKDYIIEFTSPYVSEETFLLDSFERLKIPTGRFLHINSLQIQTTLPFSQGPQ